MTEPTAHEHVATKRVRRTDIVWQDEETKIYDELQQAAVADVISIQEHIKNLLKGILLIVMSITLIGIVIHLVRVAADLSLEEELETDALG